MWKRIKDSLASGAEKIRWFSSLLNERLKIEISIFSLLYQTSEMEKKRDDLLKTIGSRVFDLRHGDGRHILRDPGVIDALQRLEILNTEIEDAKKRASEIGKVEA